MAKDANHETICRAFRQAGAQVVSLHTLGKGIPDLLIGYAGTERLVEIKLPRRAHEIKPSPKSRLSTRQKSWHNQWLGHKPIVVHTPEEAEQVLDVMAEETKR